MTHLERCLREVSVGGFCMISGRVYRREADGKDDELRVSLLMQGEMGFALFPQQRIPEGVFEKRIEVPKADSHVALSSVPPTMLARGIAPFSLRAEAVVLGGVPEGGYPE